ncbi:MAG: (2Fe-2S) ferredoxin domain-containing protein [Coleofasciculus sp. S288]|nr:(2Fe-2S) ferredoxin domain-containing protein [Coleofasciculus sp. S288]
METGSEQTCSKLDERCILVCQHRSCQAAGSAQVLAAFEKADTNGFTAKGTGCQGQCSSGPTVRIVPEETWYCRVQPNDVPTIVEQHLKGGKRVEAKLHPRIHMRFSY